MTSKIRFIVLMVIVLVMNFAYPTPSNGQATPNPTPVSIGGFHLVSPTEGWVLVCGQGCAFSEMQQLYWTQNVGQTWTNITPPNPNGAYISGVFFADNQHGVAILIKVYQPTGNAYSVARTSDGGKTWVTSPMLTAQNLAPDFTSVSLQFLDRHTGWLVLRELRDTQFDIGVLFKTTDGGATWSELNLPHDSFSNASIGDPVYFVSDQLGWVVSRPTVESRLYRTQDGGQTWQTQTVGVVPAGASEREYQLPQFVNAHDGQLTVGNTVNNKGFEEVYITHDGGMTWQLDSTLDGFGPVRLLDSTH